MDIIKDRYCGNSDRFFSGSVLRQKDHEAKFRCKGSAGRDTYAATGAAAHGGRIFSATDLQYQKTIWKLPYG